MSPTLKKQIQQMTLAEKLQLMRDLLDDIAADQNDVSLSQEVRQLLDHRVAAYRKNPSHCMTWEEMTARLDQAADKRKAASGNRGRTRK